MRLADADLLPFAFTNLAETANGYVKQLQQLRDTRAEQIGESNRAIGEGVYLATSDPRNPTGAPTRREPPPQFNFAPLMNAADSLTRAAARYEKAFATALAQNSAVVVRRRERRTSFRQQRLLQAERALTSNEGLNGRPWYRHLLYAPGFYTGYGVKTMPGPREAIEQDQWKNTDREIARVAAALEREATMVSRLAEELSEIR